jgi:acetyltransferase-like isoleucine patch superfamily enzyme
VSRLRRWRRIPWLLRYQLGWRVSSRIKRVALRAANPGGRIEFRGPVRIGPGFRVRIPEAGRLVVGPGCDFRRGFTCEIRDGGRVEIGAETTFTFHALVRCSTRISIGQRCAFGQLVLIDDDPDTHTDDTEPREGLRIGDGVGVGDKATVLADIGERAMIASQAVVTRPVPDYCVAAGSPARVVRYFGAEEDRPGR